MSIDHRAAVLAMRGSPCDIVVESGHRSTFGKLGERTPCFTFAGLKNATIVGREMKLAKSVNCIDLWPLSLLQHCTQGVSLNKPGELLEISILFLPTAGDD